MSTRGMGGGSSALPIRPVGAGTANDNDIKDISIGNILGSLQNSEFKPTERVTSVGLVRFFDLLYIYTVDGAMSSVPLAPRQERLLRIIADALTVHAAFTNHVFMLPVRRMVTVAHCTL